MLQVGAKNETELTGLTEFHAAKILRILLILSELSPRARPKAARQRTQAKALPRSQRASRLREVLECARCSGAFASPATEWL